MEPDGVRHETRTNICPNGHVYGPGRILVSWTPCACPPAWAFAKGHQSTQCRACEDEGWTTVRYGPHHVGGGHPSAADMGR